MKQNILFCAALLLLGACDLQYDGKGAPLAQITFNHVKPFPIYVASYEPVALGHDIKMPEDFVYDPSKLIYDYLSARFSASGSAGKLTLTVKDVSINYNVVASSNKIAKTLDIGGSDHYTVRAVIEIQLYGFNNKNKKITLTANRNIYISEHVSLVDREQAQIRGLDALIDDIDMSIRKILRNKLSIL